MKTKIYFFAVIFITSMVWSLGLYATQTHIPGDQLTPDSWHVFCGDENDSIIVHKPENAMTNMYFRYQATMEIFWDVDSVIITIETMGLWRFGSDETGDFFFSVYIVSEPPTQPTCMAEPISKCMVNFSQLLDAENEGPGTTYLWSTGATTRTITAFNSDINNYTGFGNYTVTVTNACGEGIYSVDIIYDNPNAPDLGPDIQVCNNEQVILNPQVENATTTTWYPGGINSPTLTVTTSGTYHCFVSDGNGCSGRDTIVVSIVAPTTADLCFVEFDTVSQKNSITWPANIPEAIQQILIYKETALNEWTQIGMVNNGTFNYIDTESNPAAQSYSYHITAVDSCGESVASSYHTTITLLSTYDLGTDTYGFTWSAYQGLTVSTYYLYGIKADNSIDLIGSVPGNQYMYNYLNPDEAYVRYFVAFETPECGGAKDNVLVKSNWVQSVLTGIDYETALPFAIYPNPANEKLEISINATDFEVQIINVLGQVVLTEQNSKTIDISELPQGSYFVKLTADGGVIQKRVVVE